MSIKRGLLLVLVLLAGCSLGRRASPPTPTPAGPEAAALLAAQGYLEQQLGRSLTGATLAYGPAEWPDASLGCPQDGVAYAQAITSGYRVEVTLDGVRYDLHTNSDGSLVVVCPPGKETAEPAEEAAAPESAAVTSARAALAAELGLALEAVPAEPTAIEAVEWPNTALGCPQEGVMYAEMIVPGYRIELVLEGVTYDLRASQDGSLALVCPAAGVQPLSVPDTLRQPFEAARSALAEALGVAPADLLVEGATWEAATFASSSLECPRPGEVYVDVPTEGYRLALAVDGQEYEVHTDLAGVVAAACLEPTPVVAMPAGLQAPLLKARALVAEGVGVSLEELELDDLAWEQATFADTSLDCPEVGQAYADVLVPGYRLWLTVDGAIYEVHGDAEGTSAVVCQVTAAETQVPFDPQPGRAPSGVAFTAYGDPALDFWISYPLGWTVRPALAEGEVLFGAQAALGMLVTRLDDPAGDPADWLTDYRVGLYAADPSALQASEREAIGEGGWSQRFIRQVAGVEVIERASFFAGGLRLLQWAPSDEWDVWDDPFLQMLDSLVIGLADTGG